MEATEWLGGAARQILSDVADGRRSVLYGWRTQSGTSWWRTQ